MDIGCSTISEAGGLGLCPPEAIGCLVTIASYTVYMGKFWCGKKLVNLVNRMPFANVMFYMLITSFCNQLYLYT